MNILAVAIGGAMGSVARYLLSSFVVRVSGPLARGSWSGPPNEAPARLRGWVSLRQRLLGAQAQSLIHQTAGAEEFTLAF